MNITADGTYPITGLQPGMRYAFGVSGTFGGGTLALKWGNDQGVYTTFNDGVADLNFTTNGGREVLFPLGIGQVVLTGSGGATIDIYCTPCKN